LKEVFKNLDLVLSTKKGKRDGKQKGGGYNVIFSIFFLKIELKLWDF